MKRPVPSSDFIKALPSLLLRDTSSSSGSSSLKFSSWKGLFKLPHSFGLTTAALVGAGTIGALLLFRQVSNASFPAFSWMIQASGPAGSGNSASELEQLTVPGLRNAGNNCFLNVILQALASSSALLSFVAAYGQESAMSMFQGVESSCPTMPLAEAVSALLEELSVLDTKPRSASPRHVMLALELYVQQFDLAAQQDAAEALAHLASALQEERLEFFESCRAYVQSLFDASNNFADGGSFNAIDMDMGNKTEKRALHIWRQHLHWPMEGTMGSLLTCQECSFQFSTQFQFFHDVPLSPPQQPDGNIMDGCTIEDCLEQFTAPECITNVRCSQCSHFSAVRILRMKSEVSKAMIHEIEDCSLDDDCSCEALMAKQGEVWRNAYTNAFKQLRFGRCPEVLCLHIQRAIISGSGELMKLTGHVSFPLVLNLFPYTISAQAHSRESLNSAVVSEAQMKVHDDALNKILWQNGALRLQRREESHLYRVPSNPEESTSDDTNLSMSSGSEDLTSNSSFGSVSRKLGDEMMADPQDITQHRDSEASANSSGRSNVNLEELGSVKSMKFSRMSQSHVFPIDKAENGDSALKQVLSGLSGPMDFKNERTTDASNISGDDPKLHDQEHYVPGFHPLLQIAPGFHPLLQTLMATNIQQRHSFSSITGSANVDNQTVHSETNIALNNYNTSGRWLYELISVVVHHGGPRSGHYTVYRKVKMPAKNARNSTSRSATDTEECQPGYGKQEGVANGFAGMKCLKHHHDEQFEECSTIESNNIKVHVGGKSVRESESFNGSSILHGVSSGFPLKENCIHGHSGVTQSFPGSPTEDPCETLECPTAGEDTALWFRVSDSYVDTVTEEEVLMAQATLLFYERCGERANVTHSNGE